VSECESTVTRSVVDYTSINDRQSTTDRVITYQFHDHDEAGDDYGSVNIAENDSSRLAGVTLSAVASLQTEW